MLLLGFALSFLNKIIIIIITTIYITRDTSFMFEHSLQHYIIVFNIIQCVTQFEVTVLVASIC